MIEQLPPEVLAYFRAKKQARVRAGYLFHTCCLRRLQALVEEQRPDCQAFVAEFMKLKNESKLSTQHTSREEAFREMEGRVALLEAFLESEEQRFRSDR